MQWQSTASEKGLKPANIEVRRDNIVKPSCKRIDLHIPRRGIFTFPEESGLPFLFDVEEEPG